MRRDLEGWRARQRRGTGGTIDSDERVRAPYRVVETSSAGARRLGRRYWREVERASRGIVRARETGNGVELRVLGRGPSLLTFGPAETAHDVSRVSCRYAIRGGVLARRPGGVLCLTQTAGAAVEVSAAVCGFAPRLGGRYGSRRWSGALYEQVQQRAHVAISRRYFRALLENARP